MYVCVCERAIICLCRVKVEGVGEKLYHHIVEDKVG